MNTGAGKVIAIYGINNLGKTTQSQMLVEALNALGRNSFRYKYGRYDLAPSGVMLNEYLRNGNPRDLSPREFQTIHVINRMQAEPQLIAHKNAGDIVVVEDYTCTGIAWGMGAGVDKSYLFEINKHLLKEDFAILLDGERFVSGIEGKHKHESNSALTNQVRQIHLDLGNLLGWHVVSANKRREDVHTEILAIVKKELSL